MTDFYSASLLAEYQRVRESLLASFPELAEDEDALADTLDGETALLDAIARLIREARVDAATAKAMGEITDQMNDRRTRIDDRADKRRAAALALMQAAGVAKVERPDFTASIGAGRPKVTITDETLLPDRFIRITRAANKSAVGDALKAGTEVPGALLGNAEPTLTVRTR